MSEPIRVAELNEIPDGRGKEFVVEGKIVAIFRTGETCLAVDGICPHAGGPIAKGHVCKGVVTCPWHGWQFHLETGKHMLSSQIKLATYRVEVRDGAVFVVTEPTE